MATGRAIPRMDRTQLGDHVAGRVEAFLAERPNELTPAQLIAVFLHPDCFTGGRFDSLGRPARARTTVEAEDLVAVTMLSIEIRLRSKRGIDTFVAARLLERQSEVEERLAEVDEAAGGWPELHRFDEARFDAVLGSETSPGHRLWALLRKGASERGLGLPPVATNKLLARLRPDLFPILDSVLEAALAIPRERWWEGWWGALKQPQLVQQLEATRQRAASLISSGSHGDSAAAAEAAAAAAASMSLLRVADVSVWMRQHGPNAKDIDTTPWRKAAGGNVPEGTFRSAVRPKR